MPNTQNAEELIININNVEGEDIARIDGYYENMTVGSAEQLVSSIFVEDKEPYNFRTAGGSVDIGNRLTDKIVGGSLVWNQLQASTASRTNSGITYTYSNGELTVEGTATAVSWWVGLQQATPWNWYANHVYLVDVGNSAYSSTGISKYWAILSQGALTNSIEIHSPMELVKMSVDAETYLSMRVSSGVSIDPAEKYHPQVFDLTQMFGADIANYIYTLEQSNTGAGVAWFKKLFPKLSYQYNAGEIMSVKAASHDTVGFNALVTQPTRPSALANITELDKTKATRVLPNVQYQYSFDSVNGATSWRTAIKIWDLDGNLAAYPSTSTTGDFSEFVSDPNAFIYSQPNKAFIESGNNTRKSFILTFSKECYVEFLIGFGDTTTSSVVNNACLHLVWSGYRNGEYEEYKKHSYPLDTSLELRGVPKLDASNNVYYDGDTYEADGTVTRKYQKRAYASGDESLSDAITDGTNTVVKLAEPTTESAEPFQSPQIVDDFGTEEYVDYGVIHGDREVSIPVGHETQYMSNLRDKLQRMPDMPNADGDYLVRCVDGQLAYVISEIPSAPTSDGDYILHCNVSNGEATYSWESES